MHSNPGINNVGIYGVMYTGSLFLTPALPVWGGEMSRDTFFWRCAYGSPGTVAVTMAGLLVYTGEVAVPKAGSC